MMERWLPVVGFEGLYEVSDHGRVRSLSRTVPAKNGSVRLSSGRVLSTKPGASGYARATLSKDGHPTAALVHLLVLEAFVGPCPKGMECRHLDGDRTNARLSNLRWGTRLENAQDKRRHGTMAEGERQGAAKLTAEAAAEIRSEYARGGVTQAELAARFGVCQRSINQIVNRRTWRSAA